MKTKDTFKQHDLSVANENTIEQNKRAGKRMINTIFKSLGYVPKKEGEKK